jgi:hypothetical protein
MFADYDKSWYNLHYTKLKLQRSLIVYHSTNKINSKKRIPALKCKLDPLR